MTRFYHAFKWQTVVDVIRNKTKGIVLIASETDDGAKRILGQLTEDEKARVVEISSIYDQETTREIISAATKPKDQSWNDWANTANVCWWDTLPEGLQINCLVLMDHPNRTNNLHKIIAETRLYVFSSTEKTVKQPTGKKDADGDEMYAFFPNVNYLYGRPELPNFEYLSDELSDLYRRDDVHSLDDLIPVYDFSVRSVGYRQLLDEPLKKREPLVLLNEQPMLWSESITEIFGWRGTGKTMFSLGLALHLAAGKPMPGLEVPSPRKVLYVEGELPASQLQERIWQLSAGLEIPAGGFEVIAKSLQPHNKGQSPVTINTEAGRLAVEAEIERTGAEVLFIDSIASLAQISTNNEEAWLPIIEWFVELRCKGLCVVYDQQAGKAGEQRGHSVSEDRLDLAIKLTTIKSNPGCAAFEMSFTKEREGSLTPLRLKCSKGVWTIDESKKPVQAAKATKSSEAEHRDVMIVDALRNGESQRDIATRFKTSLRTVNDLNQQLQKETTNDHTSTHISS
jgi:KaiC/GvpD/RAD55 family RecA-like ATPase